MSEFYLLKSLHKDGDVFIREFEDPADFGEEFADGLRYPKDSPRPRFFYHAAKERKTDYLLGIFSIPVVSQRFRSLLLELEPDHVEFHTAEVICYEDDSIDDTYSFLQILDNVSCFDRERSRFRASRLAPSVILAIESLVLDEKKAQGRHIFRMTEFSGPIIVSAALRLRIEEADLSGVRFLRLDEYPE